MLLLEITKGNPDENTRPMEEKIKKRGICLLTVTYPRAAVVAKETWRWPGLCITVTFL